MNLGKILDNYQRNFKMSSPCEALRAEATVTNMKFVIRQNISKSGEKALRLPDDQSRRIAFEELCKLRLKRRDARSEVENLCKDIFININIFEFFTVKL